MLVKLVILVKLVRLLMLVWCCWCWSSWLELLKWKVFTENCSLKTTKWSRWKPQIDRLRPFLPTIVRIPPGGQTKRIAKRVHTSNRIVNLNVHQRFAGLNLSVSSKSVRKEQRGTLTLRRLVSSPPTLSNCLSAGFLPDLFRWNCVKLLLLVVLLRTSASFCMFGFGM